MSMPGHDMMLEEGEAEGGREHQLEDATFCVIFGPTSSKAPINGTRYHSWALLAVLHAKKSSLYDAV